MDGAAQYVSCPCCGVPNHPARSRCQECTTMLPTAHARLRERNSGIRRLVSTSVSPIARLLTLERQREGVLERQHACTDAEARVVVEEMVSDALDYAHYKGPFWLLERGR